MEVPSIKKKLFLTAFFCSFQGPFSNFVNGGLIQFIEEQSKQSCLRLFARVPTPFEVLNGGRKGKEVVYKKERIILLFINKIVIEKKRKRLLCSKGQPISGRKSKRDDPGEGFAGVLFCRGIGRETKSTISPRLFTEDGDDRIGTRDKVRVFITSKFG